MSIVTGSTSNKDGKEGDQRGARGRPGVSYGNRRWVLHRTLGHERPVGRIGSICREAKAKV